MYHFKPVLIDALGILCEIVIGVNTFWPHWWEVNIGPGKGLMLSGNKLLPEPILTFYETAWHHQG